MNDLTEALNDGAFLLVAALWCCLAFVCAVVLLPFWIGPYIYIKWQKRCSTGDSDEQ